MISQLKHFSLHYYKNYVALSSHYCLNCSPYSILHMLSINSLSLSVFKITPSDKRLWLASRKVRVMEAWTDNLRTVGYCLYGDNQMLTSKREAYMFTLCKPANDYSYHFSFLLTKYSCIRYTLANLSSTLHATEKGDFPPPPNQDIKNKYIDLHSFTLREVMASEVELCNTELFFINL